MARNGGNVVWHQDIYCTYGERDDSYVYHIKDGWIYHYSWSRGNTLYLKCAQYKSLGCPGRAIVHTDRGFRHTKGHHFHQADPLKEDEMELRSNVLDRCRSMETTPLKEILRQERARFDRRLHVRFSYPKMRSSMLRARRSMFPPPPNSLHELADILEDPQYEVISKTSDGQDSIFSGRVETPDGHCHILFASQRMLSIMRRCRYIFSDGTFKVVPSVATLQNRRAQVFVIVTSWRGHTLPLAWALMEHHQQVAYEALLTEISNLLDNDVVIDTVITDDEPGQYNAWLAVFPGVNLQDCLFHMCRSFVHNMFELGLGGWLRNPHTPQVLEILKIACALPLLPRRHLTLGWHFLRREARRVGGIMIRNLMDPFFVYLWDNYVGNVRKRQRMSVFGSEHRTNNCCESLNRVLIDKFGPHPGIYDFISGLVDLEDQAYADFITLQQGLEASRARKTSALANDAALTRLGRDLLNAPLGIVNAVIHFLRGAAHRVDGVVEDLVDEH